VALAAPLAFPTATVGRDPNSLTIAYGRLPNDRPHLFRLASAIDVPRTGFVVTANFRYVRGKPWAATAQIAVAAGRSAQSPRAAWVAASIVAIVARRPGVEVHSRSRDGANRVAAGCAQRSQRHGRGKPRHRRSVQSKFARPTLFVDPHRAMLSVRMNLGRP
jgi:hypothetical protein